jgi:hypothetical protein
MEAWRKVWREGLAPLMSTNGLQALKRGLLRDDSRLTQGATTVPPPMQCVLDWPVEGACVVGYSAWQGDGLETVGEIEEVFARTCFEADQRLGEPAAVRYFLNWYDDAPRDEMRKQLLTEVARVLSDRFVPGTAEPSRMDEAAAA